MYQIQFIIAKKSSKGIKIRSLSPEQKLPFSNFFKKYENRETQWEHRRHTGNITMIFQVIVIFLMHEEFHFL